MVAGQDTTLSCTCGALTGTIRNVSPATVVHARCFCADCRAAEVYHQQPDPGENGVDLTMIDPATLSIDSGTEHLAVMRIYPKGIFRWYAACCGARLFNTVYSARFVFVTVCSDRIATPSLLGPEVARAFVPQPDGTTKNENAARLYLPMIRRSLLRLITGRWRDNPLFDPASNRPVAVPHVLTREDRHAIGLTPKS